LLCFAELLFHELFYLIIFGGMDLKVTIIQTELHWESVAENLNMFSEKIAAITEKTDLIVLPEMFNTGFSMQSETLSEVMNGETVSWMIAQSKKKDVVLVGSLIIEEEGMFYNRLVWVEPNGVLQTYDKRHLFRMANEHAHFTGGTERLIITYKGWRICPLVCYDLRFPVWARNKKLSVDKNQAPNYPAENSTAYDLLIYIANWPEVRKAPWSKLLDARAIENQCYVVGVNRVGKDGKGFSYSGNSVIINPKGETISTLPERENATGTVAISLNELNNFRTVFPVGMDADTFTMSPIKED
jgi:predicted amidohydrolase